MSKVQSEALIGLNKHIKELKQQHQDFSNIGKLTLNSKNYGQSVMRASQTPSIPVKATGKFGEKYQNNILSPKCEKPDELKLRQALSNIKKKLTHKKLNEKGIFVNEKPTQDQGEQFEIDKIVDDIEDRPNPHYRKWFHPDMYYDINVSDDEDPMEKEQMAQFERHEEAKTQEQTCRKNLLQRVNKRIKEDYQRDLAEEISKDNVFSKKAALKSIMKKNITNFKDKRAYKKNEKQQNDEKLEEKEKNSQDAISEQGEEKKNQNLEELVQNSDKKPNKNEKLQVKKEKSPIQKKKPRKIQFKDEQQQQKELEKKENQIDNNTLPKWKLKSEAFRAVVRLGQGQKMDNQEQELAIDALNKTDLTPCPHCGRKFNEKAAAKHIPICEDHKLTEMAKKPRVKKVPLKLPN